MIHPQLAADCHHLGRLASGELLLNCNAALPWFILVPDTELEDVLDLTADDLALVLADSQRVSAFLKNELGMAKTNFAGLGNVVPQMHLHIIGRQPDDACWPQPVWGNLEPGPEYDKTTLADWQQRLQANYGLQIHTDE